MGTGRQCKHCKLMGSRHNNIRVVDNREDGLEKAISWQRYKRSTIMKVPGKSANEPTWFQPLSHVCSFYGVGAVKAGKKGGRQSGTYATSA